MKNTLKVLSTLLFLGQSAGAAEVYFDTVNTARASRLQGAYVSAFGGGADVKEVTTTGRLRGLNIEGKEMGWIGGLEFGYKWVTPVGLNLAAELEFTYLNQEISGRSGSRTYRSNLRHLGAMANGIVQLDLRSLLGEEAGWLGRIKPYGGVGLGFGYGEQANVAYSTDGGRERTLNDGGQAGFTYQILGGVEVEVSDNFSVYGEYRYLDVYDFGEGDLNGAEISSWVVGLRFQY